MIHYSRHPAVDGVEVWFELNTPCKRQWCYKLFHTDPGTAVCHEHPVWRVPRRLHFLFWMVYFPRHPHCPPLHCNPPFVR